MPISSSHTPVNVPLLDIWSFIFSNPRREFPPEHEVMVDVVSKRRLTYGQVNTESAKIGKGLIDLWKWEKGQVMAVCAPNCSEYAMIVFSTLWAGGVVAPLNPMSTVDELTVQLKASAAKAIATSISHSSVVHEAAKRAGISADRMIILDDDQEWTKNDCRSLASLKNHASDHTKPHLSPRDDLAFLVFSSGTTGLPKGVMLSHYNVVTNILQNEVMDAGHTTWQRDRCLGFLPMYHIYGLAVLILQPFYKGIAVFILPRFDLQQLCDTIEKNKITVTYVVPPVVLALVNSPVVSKYNLSSLRMLHSSAAPLPPDLVEKIYRKLKLPVKQGYGASEAAPGISAQSCDNWDKPIGSSGRLIPSMHLKVMENGEEVAVGKSGEIWVSGPNIFKGYLNNPDATKECLDADGYYHTGDIGYIDKDDNIFITDRLKELIKYNGFQVAPAELEAVLLNHPAVKDTAVIGVYDKAKATEIPRAYIVTQDGHIPDSNLEAEILAWMHPKVAPYKRLRGGIEFIDAIPKSAAGKILRRILTQRAAADATKSEVRAKL